MVLYSFILSIFEHFQCNIIIFDQKDITEFTISSTFLCLFFKLRLWKPNKIFKSFCHLVDKGPSLKICKSGFGDDDNILFSWPYCNRWRLTAAWEAIKASNIYDLLFFCHAYGSMFFGSALQKKKTCLITF